MQSKSNLISEPDLSPAVTPVSGALVQASNTKRVRALPAGQLTLCACSPSHPVREVVALQRDRRVCRGRAAVIAAAAWVVGLKVQPGFAWETDCDWDPTSDWDAAASSGEVDGSRLAQAKRKRMKPFRSHPRLVSSTCQEEIQEEGDLRFNLRLNLRLSLHLNRLLSGCGFDSDPRFDSS
uniref:Uncharacterized protein n=1 Tax=Haptolina ericina TaxID=156174 RepID=A0A7S3C5C4_9EUKA|mmetsp:Transcript_9430/g.21251  ORF Transcript_9430/g.21251 Transcript_9430/m.21251 type:complete len:180 (+) Transcript_9430:296-835(+)